MPEMPFPLLELSADPMEFLQVGITWAAVLGLLLAVFSFGRGSR